MTFSKEMNTTQINPFSHTIKVASPLLILLFALQLKAEDLKLHLPDYEKEANELRFKFEKTGQSISNRETNYPPTGQSEGVALQTGYLSGQARGNSDTMLYLLALHNLSRTALPKLNESERLVTVSKLLELYANTVYHCTIRISYIDDTLPELNDDEELLKKSQEYKKLLVELHRMYTPMVKELLKYPRSRESLTAPMNEFLDLLTED